MRTRIRLLQWWLETRRHWIKLRRVLPRNYRRGKCRGSGYLSVRSAPMSAAKFRARNGAKSLLTGKCNFALKNDAIADARGDAGLYETCHAPGDFRFEVNGFDGQN